MNPSSPQDAAVRAARIHDRLAQVLEHPEHAFYWHALKAIVGKPGEPLVDHVVATIAAGVPASGLAGLLRGTFLWSVTGDFRRLAEAAQGLVESARFDPQAALSFANNVWALATNGAPDRTAFTRLLMACGVPKVMIRLGACAEEAVAPARLLRPRRIDRVARVAIVAPHLLDDIHPPTTLAVNHAALLASHGVAARVFALQEQRIPNMAAFDARPKLRQLNAPQPAKWRAVLPGRFEIVGVGDDFSLPARWRAAWQQIDAFDPDAVLFVGFYSPLVEPLFRRRPVVQLSVHTVPPIGPGDVWLAADGVAGARPAGRWAPTIEAGEVVRYPYRIALAPAGEPVARAALGLPDDAVVMLSVGFRLQSEIRGEWAARMLQLLEANPRLHWVLLGGPGEMPAALGAAHPRIHPLRTSPKVREHARSCDLYVNPPRVGGGFSVATAMAEGLPVLSHAGTDGGDKAGDAAVRDDDAYFRLLQRLIREPARRRIAGATMRARFAQEFDLAHAAPALLAALARAVDLHRARTPGDAP